MEALRFTKQNKKLEYVNIPVPTIKEPNDVLVKIAFAGVCGTDLHIISGDFPCLDETFTLGHEFSGTVVDIGPGVKNVKKGDRVSVDPNDGCRCCDFCHSGNPHYCDLVGTQNLGVHKNGGFSTYAVVPKNLCQKLPDSITLEQGALTEPLSCLSHGWDMLSPVPVGSRILVIGAGIIGSLWVCLLHLQGHRKVTVSEPNVTRLNFLKKLDTGYELITPDQLKKNRDNNPNYSFDVVIDCSGFCPALEQGLNLLDKGGKLCCFGIPPPSARISISPFELYEREITILAVKVNPFSFVKSVGFVEALGSRYLDYEKLGIKVFDLKDYQEAFDCLKSGKVAKAMFKL